jgi:hypothetical protein
MASYKTPNGTIVEESILREKYGSRFDELVSNGTFTLEEEEVVKKKDLDFPIQEEVTESITEAETPATSLDSSEEVVEVELEDPKNSFDSEVFREMTPEEKISTGTDDYNYLEEIKNSAVGGWYAGSSVNEAFEVYKEGKDISSEDLQEYIEASDKISSIPPSRDMQEFTQISDEAGGGVWGFVKGISQTGSAVIPQVIAQSMTTMGRSLVDSEEVAGTALLSAGAGALSGAAIGSTGFSLGPLGLLTTAGGAIAGTISGFIGGLTGTMETGLVLTEFLKEELGDKEFNEENIRDILEDEELFNKMKQNAVRRGVTIGAVEAATAGLSRGIATNLAKKGLDAPKIAMRVAPLEMAGGGLGETGGRLASGQELSATEIGLETIAESKGLINVSDVLSKAQKQQPTYTINGGRASKENVIDLINSLNKENIKQTVAKINIKNDPETSTLLQDKLDDISLETQIPANIANPETRTKLVELEKERKSLENNTTQSAKNRVIEIDNQIKNLQQDAIQEQETGDILDAEPTESVQEVEEEVREPSIETEEEAVIKDSQIPTSKEIYTIETEEGEGVRTVEITINKDGSRSVVQKVDGDVASSDNIPAANTLNNNEYVEGSFGPIVGEPQILAMEEVMNPKMKDKLTTKQKQELGIAEEVKVYDNINDDLEVFGEFTKNVESGRDFGNLPGEVQNIIDLGQRLDEQGVTVEVTRDLGIVDGRQILEITASNGEKFLMYKSKGTGTGPASKGKWVPLPGFAKDGYFIKGAFNPETGKTFIPTGPLSEANNPKFNKYGSETFKKLAEQLESETTIKETPSLQTAEEDIIIYKGTGGKRDAAGNLKTRHPGAKGSFFSADKNIAETYKGEGEIVEDVIPAGATIEEIEIDTKGLTPEEFNKAEEDAINASEADVVKLTTIENRGKGTMKEVQYIVKKKPSVEESTKQQDPDIVLPTGNKFKDAITRFKKTFLTARKFLPKVWYDIIQNKTAQVQGDVDELSNLNRDYNKAINKIKDKNERQATEEAAQKLLAGEEVEVNEEVRGIVTQMREMIDSLSRKLLNDPTISEENKEIIKSNLGSYLNRAYRIYDNNNWKGQVEMGLQNDILNSAKDYLRGQIKRENPGFSEAQVENDVELAVQEILRGKEGSKWLFGTGVEGKNLKILTQKKQIPLQIKMLMGEYTDVAQTFAKTIINLSSLTNTSQMLRDLTAIGLQTGILKTKDQRTPEFNYQIKGDGSKAFEEIAGLYTTKEIADQFNEMTEQKSVNPALALWYKIVSLNKYGKTILSPQTHAVNFFSNVGFAAVNGYGNVQELSKAYEAFRNLTRGKKFNRELYNKYIRLGLIDKSVGLSEARELFSDENFESAVLRNIDKKGNNILSKINSKLKKVFKKVFENPYQAEDDFWKIYAFENEKIRYSNALYNKKPSDLTEAELSEVEKIAAENVKKVLPSYDQIPDGVKKLRSIPVVGSFVSFQYESYRTALNTIKLGMSELKDPKLRGAGAKRVGGSITYVAARNALLGYFGKAAGIGIAGIVGSLKAEDDEKEKKRLMKRYLFEWQKESDILPLDIKDGKFSFIDISGSDPHGAINKTINGMTDAESVGDAAIIGFTESTIKPFLGGEMTAILLNEVINNKTSKGGQIYNDGDPDDVKYEKQVEYIMKQAKPSFFRQYDKIVESDEKLSTAGQMAVGLKKYNLDINKQFGYKASSFKYDGPAKTKYAYKKAYNEAVENNASQEELNDIYENYKEEYDERYNEFHLDYISARDVFGVDPKQLYKTMNNLKLGESNIRQIIYGNLPTLPKNPNIKTKKSSSSRVTAF